MIHRAALLFLGIASGALFAASLAGGRWAMWVTAILGALFPVALAVLGAVRPGRLGWWRRGPGWALAGLAMLLGGAMAAVLLTTGQAAAEGGLPIAGRWLIGALWLAPLVVSVTAYAVTFRRWGLTDADLERVRRSAVAEAPPGEP